MAKSFRLPSPEAYGRRLAERKAKASRVPEILKAIAAIESALSAIDKRVSDLPVDGVITAVEESESSQRQALGEAIEAIPLGNLESALSDVVGHIERVHEDLRNQLAMLAINRPPPVEIPKPVDISGLQADLKVLLARQPTVVQAAPQQQNDMDLTLRVIERDEDGDISEVTVERIRH